MTTITVTINLDDPNGVDSRYLFPGSIASSVTSAFSASANGLLYQSGGETYELTATGSNFALDTPSGLDLGGLISGIQLFKSGSMTAAADLEVTSDGASTTIAVNSVAELTPDGLLNVESFFYDVEMVINGGAGNDKIYGSDYHDSLFGSGGHDVLYGFAGSDTFQFSSTDKADSDHVVDFAHLTDTIALDSSTFLGITNGNLVKTFHDITKGGFAVEDKNDRLLYDQNTGKLYYDADGNHAGGEKPELIATFDNHAHLDIRDFELAII